MEMEMEKVGKWISSLEEKWGLGKSDLTDETMKKGESGAGMTTQIRNRMRMRMNK
jgi:hypothetical protein